MKKKLLRIAWRAWLVISVLLFFALAVVWSMSTDRHIAIGRWVKLNNPAERSHSWLVTFHDGWFLWDRRVSRLIDRSPIWIPMPSGGMGWMPPYHTLPDPDCSKCGYDLRGSENGTSCPECGKATNAAAE
jgi:hypothetical protein